MQSSASPGWRGAARALAGSAKQGRAIYERNCQGCHGADLRGNSNYPSLIDITSRLGADTVRSTVSGGRGPMPAFGTDIKEGDMDDLLAYLNNPAAAGDGNSATPQPEKPLGGPVVASGGAPMGKDGGGSGGRGARKQSLRPDGWAAIPRGSRCARQSVLHRL